MKYRYFLVPIVILALLLAGCGMNPAGPAMNIQAAAQQSTEVKSPAGQAGETVSTGVTKANPAPGQRRENCPVTRPPNPAFTPPAPYPAPPADEFWYGTTALWTRLPDDGAWYGLPHDEHGYSQKVFWWREGYHSQSEPQPVLTVTGKRLATMMTRGMV